MKSKFLYGAMALAAVLSACTSEVLEPTTTDFTGIKGHDLVSEGLTITTKATGKETRVRKDADGNVLWEASDRLGLAWYDVAGNIYGVQESADYAAKKSSTDADKKLYANNILSITDDLSAFQTRANIYQGAYFVYSPWAYLAQVGELKFVVDGVQKEDDFTKELLNKIPWLSGTRYIAAADAPKDGDFEQSFEMNPVQNACKVIATPSEGVKKAFAEYTLGSTTLTATENPYFDDEATGLGTNIFAASMTVDPNALPDEDASTYKEADKAVKEMVTPEYTAAAAAAATELEVECKLANENTIRVFMFPTNGENYVNAAGDDVIVPATTFKLPVVKDDKQIGYFEITKDDKDKVNVSSVLKFGQFLTPVLTDADGKYIAGGYGGRVAVDPIPPTEGTPGTPATPGYWEFPGDVTLEPNPDTNYHDVDPATGEEVPGLEVIFDSETGVVTYIRHWIDQDKVGAIWHEGTPAIPGTPGTPGVPGIPEKPGYTLTEILRTDAGQPTFVNLPINLTADNFHFSDYISNIDEWNERVELVDALYGDTKGVVEFILDGEVDFTNEIPVPACADTLKVTAVEGGSMKVVKGEAVEYPAKMKGVAIAADLHENDEAANPVFIVASGASLEVKTAVEGVIFGTEAYKPVGDDPYEWNLILAGEKQAGCGLIYMTTTASAVDMSAGNNGGIFIYEYATENKPNGEAATVTKAEGTSITYLVDEASLVDAGAIDNLLANAPVSDFFVGKGLKSPADAADITLTMNNSTSTEAINLTLINGFIVADGTNDVAFRNVYSSLNSGITAEGNNITLKDVEVADGILTTNSNNITTEQLHSEGKGTASAFITIDGTAALTKLDAGHESGLNIVVDGKGVVTGIKTSNPIVTVKPGVKSNLTSE